MRLQGTISSQRGSDGFALMQMAIVLVIIGLIVGGVTVARSMIRSSELQSVITDWQRYRAAVNLFEAKYGCLPGDCGDATAHFGTNASCPDGADVSGGTCNGNGDGQIDNNYVSGVYEPTRFWQQLALADIIPGKFTGYFQGWLGGDSNGTKVPTSRLTYGQATSNGVTVWWPIYYSGHWYNDRGNRLVLGQITGEAWMPTISAIDAFNLDKKIDDGVPNTGIMLAQNAWNLAGAGWYASGCTTGTAAASCSASGSGANCTAYDLTQNAPYCVVAFGLRDR